MESHFHCLSAHVPWDSAPFEIDTYLYIYLYTFFLYRNVKFARLSIFSWGKSIYFFEEAGIESREPETYFLANFTDKKSLSILARRPVLAAPDDSIN